MVCQLGASPPPEASVLLFFHGHFHIICGETPTKQRRSHVSETNFYPVPDSLDERFVDFTVFRYLKAENISPFGASVVPN